MVITCTELLEVIRNGEGSGAELKRDDMQNRTLAREIVAMDAASVCNRTDGYME
jgi:hypothetical protein